MHGVVNANIRLEEVNIYGVLDSGKLKNLILTWYFPCYTWEAI